MRSTRIVLPGLLLILLAGCATTAYQPPVAALAKPTAEKERAAYYLATLKAKKRRFETNQKLYEYLYDQDVDFQDRQIAQAGLTSTSLCFALTDSTWADSVMSGQDFSSYANHIDTISRCLDRQTASN